MQKKSRIIYNAVKKDFYDIIREPDLHRIVTCGRLQPQKNHILLIDAFALIAESFPEVSLHIYGNGFMKDEIQQYIEKKELAQRVILEGPTADVPSVLKNAGMFVLSSDYEGMPNALMEALAAGVPSVSTDCPCGGPRMLIKDGENGILVPVGDVEALANSMTRLLEEPGLSDNIGAVARGYAKSYLPEKVHNQWENYIKEIVHQ